MKSWKLKILKLAWPLIGVLSLMVVLQARDPLGLLAWMHAFALYLCCSPTPAHPEG